MANADDFKAMINNRRCPPFVNCSYEQYIAAGYTFYSEKEFYERREEARARK